MHACAFPLSISTFLTAVKKGHFLTWPGLTPDLITKHLPPSVFTAKGHLNQEQKHLQSTKKKSFKDALLTPSPTQPTTTSSDFHPLQDPSAPKTHNCFTIIIDLENPSTGYFDLTGKFPYKSS